MIKQQSPESTANRSKRIKTTTLCSDSESEEASNTNAKMAFSSLIKTSNSLDDLNARSLPLPFWAKSDTRFQAVPIEDHPGNDELALIESSDLPNVLKILNVYYLLFSLIKRKPLAGQLFQVAQTTSGHHQATASKNRAPGRGDKKKQGVFF